MAWKFYESNGNQKLTISGIGSGSGDVEGPASATADAIARYDDTTGELLADSAVTINDNGTLILPDSASYPPLRMTERSTEPSSPTSGDMYLDDGSNTASGNLGWRRYDGTAWEDVGATAGGGGGNSADYILLKDVKVSGIDGGTFTNGADRTRDLNTEVKDDGGHCTLSGNQFILATGTYRIVAAVPAYNVNRHQAHLYNVSDSSKELIGSSAYTSNQQTISWIIDEFTITSSKAFEIRHRCQTTFVNTGFGIGLSFGDDNTYTMVQLWKVP